MRILLALFLFCSLFADPNGEMADWQDDLVDAKSNMMTGNWYGLRNRAEKAGITLTGSYANDLMGNPAGGEHRGFANAGSFGINCLLDLERICGFKQTVVFSSFVVRHGNNLSREKIGNQFPVQQLFGRETYGLCELYLSKQIWNQKLLVKAGRLAGGNDFLASPLYGMFVNNSFCGNPIAIFFNTLFSAYPNATWGAYLHVKPHPTVVMKFACYNNNRNIFKNKYHGVYFSFKSTQGVTFISEWVYSPTLRGLPGHYKVAAYYVTGRVNAFTGGSQVGNYGYYFLFDQTIYRNKGQEITPFVALLFATPSDCNRFPFFLSSGLVYKGIVPSRPQDNLSLGFSYGGYSADIRPKQSFESIFEVNYWAWVTPWMAVTPDFQYVINPKGLGTIPNAYVLGAQILINL